MWSDGLHGEDLRTERLRRTVIAANTGIDYRSDELNFICPPCQDKTGQPSDPLHLCAHHRRQLEASKK